MTSELKDEEIRSLSSEVVRLRAENAAIRKELEDANEHRRQEVALVDTWQKLYYQLQAENIS